MELAGEVVDRGRIARHYLHVGRGRLRDEGRLKYFFYALRPAFALRWLRDHPDSALPPMALPELVVETSVGRDIADAVDGLIQEKARTREAGAGSIPDILRSFAASELELAEAWDDVREVPRPEARERADEVFARLLAP